ncbi:DUF58 domain-containing protein [Bacillus inaquosorum]|uniref:DUF58 domain-containing protein n=1 Tax=Bacillus inaquosorum TaxID=483913 RepID=UPI0022829FE5|nr:DUF58 domain-containing protein [Bacillus inaquosorum]MCY7759208.1 DUF58 domain-containing protein [Bacillus inaquosorum]MCY8733831.1 DUF58 domain-containing protein [Bacillus inaquosorum]MCY9272497.1 DUF58 domain-containing protein [Bacillus inaquosorum]MED0798176.1 DUF58 domain-containing protein [Bacillus inaquosorum]MED1174166.1 DUF58 domain-containing protein [Bacillus inaquosorum]
MKKKLQWLVYGWKLIVLTLLTGAVFSYAMFQGGFVSWFLFYAFLPFVVYAVLLALHPLRSFQASRQMAKTQLHAGDRLGVSVTLRRKLPFPLMYMVIEDCLPEGIESLNRDEAAAKRLVFPWFKRSMTMSYELARVPRGEHHFHAVRVRTGDVLGLIEKTAFYELEDTLFVYPSFQRLPYQVNEKQQEDGVSGSSPIHQHHSAVAASVRNYQPGDRFAALDWKTSARRNQLMTKEFEPSRSKNLFLLMDRFSSEAFEEVVSVTASILHSVLKNGAGAGLASVGKEKNIFPIQEGEQHFKHMLRHLAVAHCDAADPVSRYVREELGKPSVRQADKVIVTGQFTEDLLNIAEIGGGRVTVILAKEKAAELSQAENVMIERMMKRQIRVQVMRGGQVSRVV